MTQESSTVYFAFGSNIWKQQLHARCPTSEYLGIARLIGYRWIITEQGGANIIKSSIANEEVWGLAFKLQVSDEERLDIAERVPTHFSKEHIDGHLWEQPVRGGDLPANATQDFKNVKMLVYISHERVKVGKPRDEYVVRMNKAIVEALRMGVPSSYVEIVLRKFIPAGDLNDRSSRPLCR